MIMLKMIPTSCLLVLILIVRITRAIFMPDPDDPNYYHYRIYDKAALVESPILHHSFQNEWSIAFLPDNWIAIGEDLKARCEKNISVDGIFPIATFYWVKIPNPNENFHRFYDGGHSAIFLGCLQEGGILVADQWCGAPFGFRQIPVDDLTRYYEIGSFTQNPHQVGFLNSAQYVLKSIVHRLAKTVEDAVYIKGHAGLFTRSIDDWDLENHNRCFPALFGSFHQQMLLQPNEDDQSSAISSICNRSAPGNFIYITSPFKQNRYFLNMTLKRNCRLAIEVRHEQDHSILIQQELGPGNAAGCGSLEDFFISIIFEEYFQSKKIPEIKHKYFVYQIGHIYLRKLSMDAKLWFEIKRPLDVFVLNLVTSGRFMMVFCALLKY